MAAGKMEQPPKPPGRLSKRIRTFKNLVRSEYFGMTVDVVVAANVVTAGLEVDRAADSPDLWELVRAVFQYVYVAELVCRLLALQLRLIVWFLVDTAIVVLSFFSPVYWYLLVLRIYRFYFYKDYLGKYVMDLWLVCAGMARALRALGWLTLILLLALYCFGVILMGLVPMDAEGLDTELYFGNMFNTCLTMMQVATRDNWASKIVRPLLSSSPLAAAVLTAFLVATSYGLLSIAVGVLVWSTVELARAHQNHEFHKQALQDKDIIRGLTDWFEAQLKFDEKEKMTLRDLQEAMQVSSLKNAFKELDLPVTDPREMFEHFDKARMGEISVEQFSRGLQSLKEPASRFDLACVSAQTGGCVAYATKLEERATDMTERMSNLRQTLEVAYSELRSYALDEDGMGNVPEVMLRKARIIRNGPEPKPRLYN